MILVAGATGLLGSEIARRLRSGGHAVRALVRPGAAGVPALAAAGVETTEGDLKDEASLARACAGVRAVVSTVTATTSRRPGDTLKTVDRDGQTRLVAVARRVGVERFVYVSLSANIPASTLVNYKRRVEDAVRSSGMAWVILQPPAFMDIWLSPRLGWDIANARAMIVGDGTRPTSFVALSDVARFAVLAAADPRLANRNLPLGGPEALSPQQVLTICEEVTGRRFRVRRVPLAVVKVAAALLRPIAPVPAALAALAVASAEVGDPIDMAPLIREFPGPLVSVRDYVGAIARVAGTAA